MRAVHIVELRNWKLILSHQDARSPALWFFLGTDYRSHNELRAGIGSRLREIEFGQEYHETVSEFRQKYVDYIGSLYAAEGSSIEKYSGFLEKSPFISSIFQNACFIRLALKILKRNSDCTAFIICQESVMAYDLYLTLVNNGESCIQTGGAPAAVSTPEKVSFCVKAFAHIAFTGVVILSRMLTGHSSSKHVKELIRQRSDVIFIHTWMSRNSTANGTYHEGFFSDLQEKLTKLRYTPVLIPHIPYDLSFRQCLSALKMSGKFYIPEEHFLSSRALFRILGSCLDHPPHMKDRVVDGIVITGNVYYQEHRDWQAIQHLMPLKWDAIIRNFAEEGFRIRSFILLHENYSFEKVIIENFRKLCEASMVIGYQHSTVTSNHISYCLSRDKSDQQYLPDLVITNGTFPREVLIRNNYPPDLVAVGGALRYAGNAKKHQPSAETTIEEKYTLLTLPGELDESVELLEKVYEALGSENRRVIAKVHPFIPVARLEKSVERVVLARFEFTNSPLDAILPGADLLIYSTSSTCIDALSYGIPVLRILSDRRLDIDPLLDFRQKTPYIGVATHPHEIAEMIRSLPMREFSEAEMSDLERIVESIFGPVNETTYTLFTDSKKSYQKSHGN